MKIAERIVIVSLFLMLIGGGAWIYFAVQHDQQVVIDDVAEGKYEIPLKTEEVVVEDEDWRVIYPNTVLLQVGEVSVQASVADTLTERILGLSDTPFLPDDVVKLFAFGVSGTHSIWMKNMNYAIDILWANKEGVIVHIEENVSPESYPESFASPTPAWFVVETNAGFVSRNNIFIGDEVILPAS